jgi:predicted alpha/beta hydrolase
MTLASFLAGPDPRTISVEASDGHRFELLACIPERPRRSLLWLPALGVAARHYLPLAEALARRDVAVFLHEWRGHGSSSLRAGRELDWGYRELLAVDLPASEAAVAAATTRLPHRGGGHTQGGHRAPSRQARDPSASPEQWHAGSGAPWWPAFPLRHRLALVVAGRALPWLAACAGSLPGRRIGFGGNEARGVMRDWGRTATTGRYAPPGLGDLEPGMAGATVRIRAAVFADDWLAPESSLRHLLSKFPRAPVDVGTFDAGALGVRPDHFGWMRAPDAVAGWFSR